MKFSEYILESRVDDFKTKYSRKFNQETLNRITQMISAKYLDWVGKVIDEMVINTNLGEVLSKISQLIKEFDKISSNLPKTNINQYGSIQELSDAIEAYKNKPRREYKQVQGGNVVYEDDRFFVVNPINHQSSCYYGKGTKWCTAAMDSDDNFNRYNIDGKLFYILDKALPTSDLKYKIALLYKFEGDKSFWDAVDSKYDEKWFMSHNPKSNEIMKAVDDYLGIEYKEQLEIFRDKEKARKEKERLEKLRIRRIYQQRIEEANDRRANGEWDLTNENIDEEGLKANAVFLYLQSYGDYQVLTNEDREQIQSLRSEIERLTSELENSQEERADLSDSISELENELNEYDEYIDVYSLTPTGEYYDMQKFELVDNMNEEYAVGTEDEVERSAHEYAQQLLDDVGIEGFRSTFVEQYIDEDEVVETMREIYNDDVYDNPEVYLDDNQRDLSNSQSDTVRRNEKIILQLQKNIESLENALLEIEDDEEIDNINKEIEEISERMTELNEEIDEIKSEPDGDFPSDLIDEKVDELLEDVRKNAIYYIKEYGLTLENYIDQRGLAKGLVEQDGYGILNSYDGGYESYDIKGETFIVMRIS